MLVGANKEINGPASQGHSTASQESQTPVLIYSHSIVQGVGLNVAIVNSWKAGILMQADLRN